jgi:hypothetical protein
MSNDNPAHPDMQPSKTAADFRGEGSGKIQRPQVTDATSPEKDLPRGSEKETHARK